MVNDAVRLAMVINEPAMSPRMVRAGSGVMTKKKPS